MTGLAAQARRARFRAVTLISSRPAMYYGIRQLLRRTDALCIRRDTALVIEGFPRSANSTTVHHFLARQPEALHVAHHKHHAAQILKAAEWGVPAVVLVRPPRPASLSFLALRAEASHRAGKPADEALKFSDVLVAYSAFYEAIESQLDDVVIGMFGTAPSEIDRLIHRINTRFRTNFSVGPVVARPQPPLEWHAMPNDLRNDIKQELAKRFETELSKDTALRKLLARADAVHERYAEAHEHAG